MHLKYKIKTFSEHFILSIVIYIFRNFKEYQSQENRGLKKQFKRTNGMEGSREISSKIRTLFSSYFLHKWWLNIAKYFSLY